MELEVFYDYRCPYVYQAALLLRRVQETGRRDLHVRWRYFSLAQANNEEEGWTIWEAAPQDPAAKGRLAFQAAEASRRQGRFESFHPALLDARHLEEKDIDDLAVVEEVAAGSGLDLERFRADLGDPSLLMPLARDHAEARDRLGVFGTPTFHFPGRGAAYVRVRPAPQGDAVLDVFDQIVSITAEEPYFQELKRARPPRAEPAEVRARTAEASVARTSGSPR
jgi:predicted DsbA family dithiol-disulfide isomerase